MDFNDIIACAPRLPGDWRNFGAMLAFVLLAHAFRSSNGSEGGSEFARARAVVTR